MYPPEMPSRFRKEDCVLQCVLQCVAVHRSACCQVLQCVAVCCSPEVLSRCRKDDVEMLGLCRY